MTGPLARLFGDAGRVGGLPPAEDLDDDRLMLRLQRGDRAALGVLFDRHRARVWAFFRRRVPDSARAEDLAQDTFTGVLAGAARYEGRGSFRAYLFGTAFNILLDHRRRTRAFDTIEHEVPAPATDPDRALWVRTALNRLEPEEREILMLREYDQLSYQELADVLALPLNTVRSRLFRARSAMRVALTCQVLEK